MKKFLLMLTVAVLLASCGNSNKNTGAEKQGVKVVPDSAVNQPGNSKVSGEKIIERYATGKPRVVVTIEKQGDKEVTVYKKEYFENGQISKEGPILNKKRNGEWKNYYKTGELWNIVFFNNGLADSTTVAYYKDGKIRYQGQYVKGQKSGTWKLFTEKGELKEIKNYVLK